MKKQFVILILFFALIAGATYEQIYVQSSLEGLSKHINELEEAIQIDYQGQQAFAKVDEVRNYWAGREKLISVFINYKELKDIIIQISRLQETMNHADKENTFIELVVLKNITNASRKVIGFDIQNII